MKTTVLALCLTLAALASSALAQTQAEMNDEAAADFAKADKALNAAYKKLRTAQDESGREKLKAAQKAWIAYRDAEAEFEAAPNEGGSIYPLVYATVKTRITEARTKELTDVLEETNRPEGADDPNQ